MNDDRPSTNPHLQHTHNPNLRERLAFNPEILLHQTLARSRSDTDMNYSTLNPDPQTPNNTS